jgi:hypothetical protein
MSQQSGMADVVYSRLRSGPVSLASLVRELRGRWGPEHGILAVHGFLAEVATCLLHHDDVELGDAKEGRFVAWQLDPWEADHRLGAELTALGAFLEDESRYVFRKKEPIQPPETTRGK